MQNANVLLRKLNTDKGHSFGAWQTFAGAHLSSTLARTGVDWVLIDCEHGNIGGMLAEIFHRGLLFTKTTLDNEMHDAVRAVASCDVSPIVRIPENQGWMVKRALDAGAHGILVPMLRSIDDAKKVVLNAKFPPRGIRGFGSPFSTGAFNTRPRLNDWDYLTNANDSLLTIVQIETREALNNVRHQAADSPEAQLTRHTGGRYCKGRWDRRPFCWSVRPWEQYWPPYPR
jgi:4-hydroxy-2-oxoheptanedioate aldolase